jgi:hypothetical protein
VRTVRTTLRIARDNWLIILAVLINIAFAGPVAADWNNDICYVNNRAVPCCTDCSFFCSCGE